MKLPTPQQNEILIYLKKEGKPKHWTDIYENTTRSYYCNEQKYMSERLSKMVKAGFLARAGKGIFELRKQPLQENDKNQIKLF